MLCLQTDEYEDLNILLKNLAAYVANFYSTPLLYERQLIDDKGRRAYTSAFPITLT